MSEDDRPEPTRWWVVFRDPDVWLPSTRFWRSLGMLPAGFGHCFAFCEPTPGVVLLYNVQPGGIEHVALTTFPYRVVQDYRAAGARVVVADVAVVGYVSRRSLPVLTCATVTAALLGVRGLVLTPIGLYRKLMAAGAREIA